MVEESTKRTGQHEALDCAVLKYSRPNSFELPGHRETKELLWARVTSTQFNSTTYVPAQPRGSRLGVEAAQAGSKCTERLVS